MFPAGYSTFQWLPPQKLCGHPQPEVVGWQTHFQGTFDRRNITDIGSLVLQKWNIAGLYSFNFHVNLISICWASFILWVSQEISSHTFVFVLLTIMAVLRTVGSLVTSLYLFTKVAHNICVCGTLSQCKHWL